MKRPVSKATAIAVLAGTALLGTGCGTRVHQAAPGAVSGERSPAPVAEVFPAAAGRTARLAADGAASATESSPTPDGASPASITQPGAAAPRRRSSDPTGAHPAPSPTPGSPVASRATGSRAAEHGGNGGGPASGATPVPAGAVPSTRKSPVALASVGTYSGPAGTILVGFSQGAQLWVKFINARGGLNGHPVKLAVADDGGDPSRHGMLVRQAVERDRVLAFLVNAEPFASPTTPEYLREKRVPVIGISTAEPWAYANPMYFPQSSSGDELGKTFGPPVFDQMRTMGKNKAATLYCLESPACQKAEQGIAASAKGRGVELVYRGKASLGQPDFTAECLAASRAGAEAFFMVVDQNSSRRVATACSRQNFTPTYAFTHPGVEDTLKETPQFDGAVGGVGTFPWYQSNTPATAEFQQARKAFGPSLSNGASLASAWVAGKILETAGAELPEPPTSEALLAGLWQIRENDLGGITYPLTFMPDRPAKPAACWFTVAIRSGAWVTPDDWARHCA